MSTPKSRVYTKSGDRGETSLIGGKRVPKYHIRIEAYGTVDELMAHTALLRDLTSFENVKDELLRILDHLMRISSLLAYEGLDIPESMPLIFEADVEALEKSIDEMEAQLEPLYSFVLPGGHPVVSQAHISRTICRRSERIVLKLAENEKVEAVIIKYLNRLSDYYFLLSRYLGYKLHVKEIPWKP